MEPVINPMLIYLVSLCSTIKDVSVFFCILTVVAVLFFLIDMIFNGKDENEDWYISIIRYCVIGFFVSLFFIIIIPDREIALTMLATYYITPDNIQAVQGNIIEFVKQLVDAVGRVR